MRKAEQSTCPKELGGSKMLSMHPPKPFIAVVLLLAFVCSATELSAFAQTWRVSSQTAKPASCPMHASKCCCPKVCKAPKKATEKAGCHTANKESQSASAPAPTCFVKAGCEQKDTVAFATSLAKEFVLESAQQLIQASDGSPFRVSATSYLLFGHLSLPFHPPKNS